MSGYDVIVVGLGGMGSAAAAHLAKRRKRVLGLEQYALGHDLGASAGRTRIIRKAYFEGLAYVPLLLRAYELWRSLERETALTLLDLTGLLLVGTPTGAMLDGVRLATERYGIRIDELDRAEVSRRYPQTRLAAGEIGLFEADAGMVFPELAIEAHQRVARAHGAELRGATAVTGWRRTAGGAVRVEIAGGQVVEGEQLVICAGPWLGEVTCDLGLPLRVQRNVQVWFRPESDAFGVDRFPTFLLERAGLPKPVYGFPDMGAGLKAALHAYGDQTSPATLDRTVHASDIAAIAAALDAWLPGAAGSVASGKVCMYTLTPDEHFIIDRHPHDDGVIIAGGFSGHGYKFCPVVGEIVADLCDGHRRHEIGFLGLERFTRTAMA